MLREKKLNQLALALILVGLIGLLFFSLTEKNELREIHELTNKDIGLRIKINAQIDWVNEVNGAILFGLNDGEKITAVKFNASPKEMLLINVGNFVTVTGKIQQYKQSIELIAENVKEWK